jgi:hypothetical protein
MTLWIPILINLAENYLPQSICGISNARGKVLSKKDTYFNIPNFRNFKITIMKTQPGNSFETMSKIQAENLTNTVSDNLDTNFNQTGRKLFTTADMWYIHRQAKSPFHRRHSF